MPVNRTRLFIIVFSLLGSIGLWTLSLSRMPAGGGGYAALVFSEAVGDREIRQRLADSGITGIISESGQWFLLDSFSGIEQVPLDQYGKRLLPFDPRNDGYAEKLRSLFVRDGRRIMYVPVGHNGKIASALGDIPFSVEYTRRGRPQGLLFALFCLASCAFWVIRPLRSALRHLACLLPCLPPFVPLSLGGAAGFALASLLAGLAVSLAETRLVAQQHPALRRLLSFALLACYGLVAFFSGFPILLAALALALFACMFALSLRGMPRNVGGKDKVGFSPRYPGRRRFSPVAIIGRRALSLSFAWAMLPFAAVALAVAITGIAEPNSSPIGRSFLPPGGVVTEEDYQAHFLFQSTFSTRSLNMSGSGGPAGSLAGGMSDYRLGPDGLPELFSNGEVGAGGPAGGLVIPGVFPLGGLLRELDRAGRGADMGEISRPSTVPDLVLALLPMLFIVPCLIVRSYSGIFKKPFS